jgi:hypothetical protein
MSSNFYGIKCTSLQVELALRVIPLYMELSSLPASCLPERELCRTAEQGVRGCREEDVASFRRTRRLHYASEAAAMEL